jgi:transketolase
MWNKAANLSTKALGFKAEEAATRDGYGIGLVELAEKNRDVVVLCADLSESTRVDKFAKMFPNRFIQTGVAEQNMMAVAVGLALQGKIPFTSTYAVFSPGRTWDQIRISVCYNQANVKIAGNHTGLTVGEDGATHQALEDIALTRVLPNMTVIVPIDAEEARKVVHAAAEIKGPVYFRLARHKSMILTTQNTPFKIGKATTFREGNDVAIIGAGPIMQAALMVAERLVDKGISTRVINSSTIKPIDEETIVKAARECGAIVTVEEHQVMAGLGSAVAEVVVKSKPVPLEMVGMPNSFGESGKPEQLLTKYRMDADGIMQAVQKVMKRKRMMG